MAIIRTAPTTGFTVVQNSALEDPRISFKAKGVLSYLLGRPADWVVHVSHLATIGTDGKAAIYSAIAELVDAGYVERIQRRQKNGAFDELEYIVHPSPQISTSIDDEPHTDYPHPGFPHPDNRTLPNKDFTKERNYQPQTPKTEPEKAPASVAEPKTETPSSVEPGFEITDDDRKSFDLPNENKRPELPHPKRMPLFTWSELWRRYTRKSWPAGQNTRAIHVMRYWTPAEIESAFELLPKASYPGWAFLKAVFDNLAADDAGGASRTSSELSALMSSAIMPKKTISADDINRFLSE